MTRDELLAELRTLHTDGIVTRIFDGREVRDIEHEHIKADELLLLYINDPDVTEAFAALKKWYA